MTQKSLLSPAEIWQRREFVSTLTKAAAAGLFLSTPFISKANNFINERSWTVGQIMDLFIKQIPNAPFATTVDTLKSGSRDIQVKGIVTTMFATVDVIKKAIAAGANFIIAHEPTFYNHQDQTDWLKDDDVYQYKADLLQKHNITVWRNHDYVHSVKPDGVQSTLIARLGWQNYQDKEKPNRINIPAVSLKTLISHAKKNLQIPTLRYIGDLTQSCKKILLMPGASGGRSHILGIGKEQPDVLIVGEIQEWETAEYVRDANSEGKKLSLIVLGHIASEEPGSAFMASWIKQNVPGIAVQHIPAGNSLSFF
jgi:putative NIF3 family GTP cyclohydrolase 1 type 2